MQEQTTAHLLARQDMEHRLQAVEDARLQELEDHRQYARPREEGRGGRVGPGLTVVCCVRRALHASVVSKLKRELKDERELTAKLTRTVEQLRSRLARRERELNAVSVRLCTLPWRLLTQHTCVRARVC